MSRSACIAYTSSRDYVLALWAIVNNAGILGSLVPFEWTNRQHCRQIIEVNLLGAYDVTLAFLPLLKIGGQGKSISTGLSSL